MKNSSVVIWLSLAGAIVLAAVLSLVAQEMKAVTAAAETIAAPPAVQAPPMETPPAPPPPELMLPPVPPAPEDPAAVAAPDAPPATTSVPEENALRAAGAPPAATPLVMPVSPVAAPAPAADATTAPAEASKPAGPAVPLPSLVVDEQPHNGQGNGYGAATTNAPVAPPEFPPALTSTQDSKRLSIQLDDVPLQEVVRMFMHNAQANIISPSSSNMAKTVTVNLQDVEWKPALNSILATHELTLVETEAASEIYTIAPRTGGDPLVAEAIFLNYAPVSNVAAIVTAMIGPTGSVIRFTSGNALIVRTTQASILDVKRIISSIDQPRRQVYIEAKFLELTDQAIKDLGINWQVLQGYSVGLQGMGWSYGEKRDTISSRIDDFTQTATADRSDTINQFFDTYNYQYQQVDAEGALTPTRTITDSISQTEEASSEIKDSFTKTISDVRTASLNVDDFNVILSALKQLAGITLVSNPKIIVANEETASIHIGQNEPNIKGSVTAGQQGQANTTTYQLDPTEPYFKYGIAVEVTPTINNDSNISVRIEPTLSTFVKDKSAPDGTTFPVTQTKEIKTMFSLANGTTAAIGGLTQTSDRETVNKIPLLGDIPIIGKYLFSHTHTEKSQIETIIFVTVGIADPNHIERADGLPENANLVNQHFIRRDLEKMEQAKKLKDMQDALEKKKSSSK